MNAIQSASVYLKNIINEVLDYTKLAAGQENFVRVAFDVRALIKDIEFLCETLLVEQEVALKVQIAPEVPKIIMGDPSNYRRLY